MADQVTTTTAVAAVDIAAKEVASLTINEDAVEQANGEKTADQTAPHRSHDPNNNQKRTDPFMFGQRYLTEEDDVFEYNAWDHVETDDAFKEYSEKQFELQRQAPVSEYDKSRFNGNPTKWWNLFYKNNTANFFKDRKWLQQEFPILGQVCEPDAGPVTILEIGAGAGNTAFPILKHNRNPHLRLHACDFSKTAVQVMRSHESYDTQYMQADVWDVTATDEEGQLPPGLSPASVDVAILVFIFSALAPTQWQQAVKNVARVVKPGGTVLFRDYGRGDLAQVRFRKGRYLEENFYIRGDGTRVYFFDKDELAQIWTGETDGQKDEIAGLFALENMGVDRRLIVNRAMKLKMYRCWLQGRFRRL